MKCTNSLLSFILLFLSSTPSWSSQTATVGIIDFFPFGYADSNGNPTGMFVDMLEIIEDSLQATNKDIVLRPVLLPVPRAIREVSAGKLDMLISYKDPVMVPNVKFVGNVGCLSSLIVPIQGLKITRLQDLANKKVGFITGGYFHKRFSDQYGLIPSQVPSNESMMRMLIRNRVDVIVINSAVLNAYLNDKNTWVNLTDGWKNKIGIPYSLETMETHLSISDKSVFLAMQEAFTLAINKAYQQEKFNHVYNKYGAGNSSCQSIRHIQ